MAKAIKNKGKFSAAMVLIAVGIVYGDIATSPMYVMKSIIAGNGGINYVDKNFIIGSLSLVIWTLTLITTVKYVLIAMKADNNGEGGIFALFSLVKNNGKWIIYLAIIGGSALLADGMLTPAVTVTTAIEGLKSIDALSHIFDGNQTAIIIIVLSILAILFISQKAGTSKIGKAFGPFMIIWFIFLFVAGVSYFVTDLEIIKAFNPVYAVEVLFSPNNKVGIMILGSVFLATTGAEALYADMGHVGKKSIYISWPFVKIALIMNYLGQGAWIIQNINNTSLHDVADLNPFFEMLPQEIRAFGIILSTIAAIIASQALITGSFSVVSEATRLDLLPHMKTDYPSETKGQVYIPKVNNLIWIGCSVVVILFRTSSHMESAYGLAITITLMTVTVLLTSYLIHNKKQPILGILYFIVFSVIEVIFFISCAGKFVHGGYFAVLMAVLIMSVMMSWYIGTKIERSQNQKIKIVDYISKLKDLKEDKEIPITADNLVYLSHVKDIRFVDGDIMYSIFENGPKRANAYWFVDFRVLSKPFGGNYSVENYGTDFVYKVIIRLGYKEEQLLNVYMYQIFKDLLESGELPQQTKKHTMLTKATIKKLEHIRPSNIGTISFRIVRKIITPNSALSYYQKNAIKWKYTIRRLAGTPESWYGLEGSNSTIEYVPFFIKLRQTKKPLPRKEMTTKHSSIAVKK